jgi:polyhydroxybutyrate depolymerase
LFDREVKMRINAVLVFVLILTACAPAVLPSTAQVHSINTSQPVVPLVATPTPSPIVISIVPSPSMVGPGEYHNSMAFGGATRNYILHVPPAYDGSKAVPLVFLMHPYMTQNTQMEARSDMDAKADQENFVVVYPEGTGDPLAWNALFFPPRASQPDDVGFISALMDKLEHDLRINPQRIYVGGFSNGAMMTYLLGAKLSNRLAAIAVVAGSVGAHESDGSILMIPNPSRPLPVIAFHGKADTTVPYAGGRGALGVNFLSVADSIGFWVKQDGCSKTPKTTTSQKGNVVESDFTMCAQGSEVVLISIGDGKHDYPIPALPNSISATDLIWEFFARHPAQ